MKKYFALFIAVIILSFSLCLPSFAARKPVITFSEDYMNMYLDENAYVRADTAMLYYSLYNDGMENTDEYGSYYSDCPAPLYYNALYTIKLSDTQRSEVESVEICEVNDKETIFLIIIYFKDGAELHIDFLDEYLVDEYNKITAGNTDTYTIDFMWPDGNEIEINKKKLLIGDKIKIGAWDYIEEFPIYAKSTTGGFNAEVGAIYTIDENYYFFSFIDSNIKSRDEYMYHFSDDDEIQVIQLTDEKLLNEIKICEEKYYESEYGYLQDNEFTDSVSKIFFILVFAIAPAAIFVGSIIFAIKSKKKLYKKLLFATSGISLAEIVTFIYIALTLFNK